MLCVILPYFEILSNCEELFSSGNISAANLRSKRHSVWL